MENNNIPSKQTIIELLDAWIRQRPGLDPRDYGHGRDGWNAYRSESRYITGQLHDARELLRAVEWRGVTAEQLTEAFKSAFSGRLQLCQNERGSWYLDYCTGQYFPTEYRAAACAVLAYALWDYHRDNTPDQDGLALRAQLRRIYGARLARNWFD